MDWYDVSVMSWKWHFLLSHWISWSQKFKIPTKLSQIDLHQNRQTKLLINGRCNLRFWMFKIIFWLAHFSLWLLCNFLLSFLVFISIYILILISFKNETHLIWIVWCNVIIVDWMKYFWPGLRTMAFLQHDNIIFALWL